MRLDREQPYGEVYGVAGCSFEQFGHHFNISGAEVRVWNGVASMIEEASEPIPQADGDRAPEVVALEKMHWRHLRAMMETFDMPWHGREQAIEFLAGKRSEAA